MPPVRFRRREAGKATGGVDYGGGCAPDIENPGDGEPSGEEHAELDDSL